MEDGRIDKCSHRIAKALSIRNMKQSDICNKTNIPKGAMSQYISGAFEPKQDRVYLIAQALNVDPVWLMGYDVPMEKKEDKKISFDELQLTEGKRLVLELFDQIPEEEQIQLVQTIKAFRLIPEDHQKLVNQMIRAAVNNQK